MLQGHGTPPTSDSRMVRCLSDCQPRTCCVNLIVRRWVVRHTERQHRSVAHTPPGPARAQGRSQSASLAPCCLPCTCTASLVVKVLPPSAAACLLCWASPAKSLLDLSWSHPLDIAQCHLAAYRCTCHAANLPPALLSALPPAPKCSVGVSPAELLPGAQAAP